MAQFLLLTNTANDSNWTLKDAAYLLELLKVMICFLFLHQLWYQILQETTVLIHILNKSNRWNFTYNTL